MIGTRALSIVRRSSLSAALSLAYGLGAVACGSAAEGAPPTATAASAATKAPVAAQSHGMVRLFADALGDVPLRADQRATVEALASEADARHAPLAKTRADIAAALATQIEKNAVDVGALIPQIEAATRATEAAQDGDRAALQKLHGLLDASQRSAFVDAFEARLHAQMEGAHHGANGRPRMGAWAEELALTSEQEARVRDVVRELMKAHAEEWKRAHEASDARANANASRPAGPHEFLDAFRSETFIVGTLAPKRNVGPDARAMTEHIALLVKAVLPELTAEQRVKAAALVRAHAVELDGPGAP